MNNFQEIENEFNHRYVKWLEECGVPSKHLCWHIYLQSLYENGKITRTEFENWKTESKEE